MARDLETLKEALWVKFERAVGSTDSASKSSWDAYNGNLQAIAELGKAIAAVESEQRILAQADHVGPALLKKPATGP